MTEDWVAIANAIKERVNELGWRQRELAQRSHVSQAIVRELQHHTVERRRSARTLEALSTALDWHPRHLAAVLKGQRVPDIGEPVSRSDDDVPGILAAIEYRLTQIETRLGAIDQVSDRLDEINASVDAVIRFMDSNRKRVRG